LRGPLLFGWAQDNLHKELDEQLDTEDETIATEKQVKRLPYLDACIKEGLRLHSMSSLGLPQRIWGDDVESFRPERWFECDPADIQKTFHPFSTGPSCAKIRPVKNSH